MTTTVGTWLLPVQQGGDRPCDYAPVWCSLATIVDTRMAEYKAAATVGRAVSIAKAYNDPTLDPAITTPDRGDRIAMPFLLEVFDTDNMIDLVNLPTEVDPRTAGIYAAIGYAEFFSIGANQTDLLLFNGALTQAYGSADTDVTVFVIGAADPQLSIEMHHKWLPPQEGFALSMSNSAADNKISRLELVVMRIGDIP